MSSELVRLATDVATYSGAVSAGVTASALTGGATRVVGRVLSKLGWAYGAPALEVTQELIDQVAEILREDPELRGAAEGSFAHATIDRSIVINADTVTNVSQTNT